MATSLDYRTAQEALWKLRWLWIKEGRVVTDEQMIPAERAFHERWEEHRRRLEAAVVIPPGPPGRYYGD